MLSEKSEFIIPTNHVRPKTDHVKNYVDKYLEITPPSDTYEEMCYYHDIIEDNNGLAAVGIRNTEEGLGLHITYEKKMLDHFIQWKILGKGEYIMGLELGNATIEGRGDARENGSLKWIERGERISHKIKVSVEYIGKHNPDIVITDIKLQAR